jgi:GNAT superfamily N-acetyltransferase
LDLCQPWRLCATYLPDGHRGPVAGRIPARSGGCAPVVCEYAGGLGIDLEFQDFERELATLPGDYAAPAGSLLLAHVDGAWPVAAHCARSIPRLPQRRRNEAPVRKAFRGFGLGRELAEAALNAARRWGYDHVLLDTLDDMESARSTELGFESIPPYYHNPIAGAHYLKASIA